MSVIFKNISLSALLLMSSLAQAQIAKTTKGYVRGVNEKGIEVYKGIPYAAPPLGSLRFMPPAEHNAWSDTLACTEFGAIAMQNYGNKVMGSEDCLSLNVYTPKVDANKRAVLVWVHGGAMTGGSGRFTDGHAFADHNDIVTVTINYRLGVFGFMYLGDADKRYRQSGNNGLLDCVMALKWIKDNIAAFGGDPNRVTVMGESAGAKLLSAMLVSPASKGLCRQLISESGSVQCIRDSITAKNERLKILQQAGLGKDDIRKLITMSGDSLMKLQGKVTESIGGVSFFGPVYDGVTIPQDAYQYVSSGNLTGIRAIIGTNHYEAAAFVNTADARKNSDDLVIKPAFAANAPIVEAAYKQQLKTDSPYQATVKVLTRYMYQMHSYRLIKVLADQKAPLWVFRFDYPDGKPFGALHGIELNYVWDDGSKNTEPVKKRLAYTMHNAWVSFIKTGDPNGFGLPQWPVYDNTKRQLMLFDETSKAGNLDQVYNDKNFPSAVFVLR